MPEKRKHNAADAHIEPSAANKKRVKRGFKVGPDNLPDGAYRRKNQKIKQSLIDHARLKKSYAKVKLAAHDADKPDALPQPASAAIDGARTAAEAVDHEPSSNTPPPAAANPDPHPDRQALIEQHASNPQAADAESEADEQQRQQQQRRAQARQRNSRPRPMPFRKEAAAAQQRREEAEARQAARAAAEAERRAKQDERERFRRAMAKARRAGPDGRRKLGRESTVLLEKVRRLVGGG